MWNVGNGHRIRFWLDNWLGIGPIRELAQGPMREDEEDDLRVRDIVIGGKWDVSRTSMNFPDHVIDRIFNILVLDNDLEDFLIPAFVDHTRFSLENAYTYLIAQPYVDLD